MWAGAKNLNNKDEKSMNHFFDSIKPSNGLKMAILFFVTALLWNCSEVAKTENSEAESDNFPNKSSELALLMRSMYDDSEKIKKAVQEGKIPEDFRKKFADIHSSKATNPEKIADPAFKDFGNNFLSSMEPLYQQKENQVDNYNLMITNCIACHQTFCPGPIKRIKKLSLSKN
jgi:phosphoenolpyruvate carboxylase